MSAPRRLAAAGLAAAVSLLGVLVYVNTFDAEFSFDDNFAILYNRDVTDLTIPLKNLLQNDFWGSQITREDSHKSFRCPLRFVCAPRNRSACSVPCCRHISAGVSVTWRLCFCVCRPVTVWSFRLNRHFGKPGHMPHAPDFHKTNVHLHGGAR